MNGFGLKSKCPSLNLGWAVKYDFKQDLDEDVVIRLGSRNPQTARNVVRFDNSVNEFFPHELT